MLQNIRDKSQGLIAIIIFSGLAAIFALWGVGNYFYGSSAKSTVVKVNGTKISRQQFQTAYTRAQSQASNMGVNLSSPAVIAQLKKQVLGGLVVTTLLHQSANDNGFAVSPALLELTLSRLPAFQENGVFSKAKFQQALSRMNYTQPLFFAYLSNNLLLQEIRSGIVETAVSLPGQAGRALSLVHQTRSFAYVVVPAKPFFAKTTVSRQAVQGYYKTHQAQFTVPKKMRVQYIMLSLSAIEKTVHPSSAALETFYQNNINLFSVPKQWKIKRLLVPVSQEASDHDAKVAQQKMAKIYASLKKGTSFNTMATQYPVVSQLGHAGWVNLLEVPKSMQLALIKQTKPGLSAPFKTAQGFEILDVVKLKAMKRYPYAQVKARVKKIYVQQTAQKKFSSQVDRLSNITFEHPRSLKTAATQLNLTVKTSPLFSKKAAKGLFANARVLNAAFSDEVFHTGNNSDLVTLDDNRVLVLRAEKIMPATIKPFSSVAGDIQKTLRQKKASAQAKQVAQALAKKSHSLEQLASAAKKQGFQLHQIIDTRRYKSKQKAAPILQVAAFNLPRFTKMQASSTVIAMPKGDFSVLLLTAVKTESPKNIKNTERQAYTSANVVSQGNMDYALYVQGLKQRAKIKYYTKAMP
jgi:peptidyl-prolyl cis-trans isomerase D